MKYLSCALSLLLCMVLPLPACSGGQYAAPADSGPLTGEQQLLTSISQGDTNALARFLDDNPTAVNQPAFAGQTLLHHAVRFDNEKSVRLLLDRGADPRVRGLDGDSVLDYIDEHYASPRVKAMVEGRD